jgi:hypothetical protein
MVSLEIAGPGGVFSVSQRSECSKGTESWLCGGWGGVQKRLREQDVSFYRQGLENLMVYYKCLTNFGNYVEKYRTVVQR